MNGFSTRDSEGTQRTPKRGQEAKAELEPPFFCSEVLLHVAVPSQE